MGEEAGSVAVSFRCVFTWVPGAGGRAWPWSAESTRVPSLHFPPQPFPDSQGTPLQVSVFIPETSHLRRVLLRALGDDTASC